MAPNQMYQALRRGQKPAGNPQIAPIAAMFEDCRQNFERLCVTARGVSNPDSVLLGDLNPKSILVEDNYGKFLAWGNDSGASSRSLDHTLRKDSKLSAITLDLLKTLYKKLNQGIDRIQRTAEATNEFDEFETEALVGSLTSSSDGFATIGTETSKDARVSLTLEYIEGLVECLMKLAPNLCDPFPLDTYSKNAKPNDADEDISLAKILFPTATQSLLDRLAWANCRRRKYLQALLQKRQEMSYSGINIKDFRRSKRSPMRDVAVDAFNFQQPGQIEDKPLQPPKPRYRSTASYYAPSEAGASSIMESVFSRPTANESSMAGTSIPDVEVVFKQRTVPRPPIALEPGHRFLCPYCHDELDVGINVTTKDDWDVHVFADLEPYMCTFDKCLRAEKTFGVREDWFRHELESHRILKVWVCHACVKEFSSAQAFEEHLQMSHNNISGPSQMAMMVQLCVKHSQIHPRDEVCPLCALKLSVEEIRDHIASHLEQFALTSINGDESSEEDDNDDIQSVRFEDKDNESVVGQTKLKILEDFVEEQLGFVLPDKKVVADTNMDESVLDFVLDSDEEDEEEEGHLGSSKKRRGEETRDWKLGNYLDHRPGMTTGVNIDRNRFSKSPMREGMDARMQNLHLSHSSTSARTTMRTQPHPRDDDFVGRDGDLATMYRVLSTAGRICTISGTGGIGKTATAIEYDHRYENAYSYIFWIQAETHVGTADTFSLIAMALGLAPDGEDQKQLIELGREFLEQTEKRWLLIFDNVNEWADIEAYIPVNMPLTQGSVLITTRVAELEPTPMPTNYFRINLKEMTPEELQSLLIQSLEPSLKHEKVRFHSEWKTAGEIASLAGLPLAISQIVGYVKTSGCTLAEFLELWNEWWKNSLSSRPSGVSSNAALEAIWDIGLNELGKDAHKLLKILAFVDSDGIQKELLMNDHTFPGLAFLKSSAQVRFRNMITQLAERKLITVRQQNGRDVYSVHRLLQHRLLQDLTEDLEERDETFVLAFELIRERLPRPSGVHDSTKWNTFKEYLPHVLTLQRIYGDALPPIAPFVRLANLFKDGGVHLWQRGMIYDGLRLLKSAEMILDLLDCQEDQMRIDIHIATALLIQYFGISHRKESKERFWKILQIRKKAAWASTNTTLPTKEHGLLVCNALADYGNSLLQFNNYKEAEPIYQECYVKYQVWGNEDEIPFEYAKFNHHMAFCRMYHKDFKGAIKLAERAVELVSRQPGSPQLTMRFKFDLATIIMQSGEIEKSLEIQEQILKARLVLQGNGKTNYFTLQSYYAVGALYAHLKKWDEAEVNMRTALMKAKERADKGFWPEAAVARTEYHLSQIIRERGKDSAEAEGLVTKARSVLSRLLPYDPLDGVSAEDELALFDHLQPVFGGRFTGLSLLKYIL